MSLVYPPVSPANPCPAGHPEHHAGAAHPGHPDTTTTSALAQVAETRVWPMAPKWRPRRCHIQPGSPDSRGTSGAAHPVLQWPAYVPWWRFQKARWGVHPAL